MIKEVLAALVVVLSFWLGQVLYLWAKEEVDAFRKVVAEKKSKEFSKLIPWYHSALYSGVLGFAQAIAPRLESFEIISLVLFAVGLILWSVVYANSSWRKSIKSLLISTLVFLGVFAVFYGLFNFLA